MERIDNRKIIMFVSLVGYLCIYREKNLRFRTNAIINSVPFRKSDVLSKGRGWDSKLFNQWCRSDGCRDISGTERVLMKNTVGDAFNRL